MWKMPRCAWGVGCVLTHWRVGTCGYTYAAVSCHDRMHVHMTTNKCMYSARTDAAIASGSGQQELTSVAEAQTISLKKAELCGSLLTCGIKANITSH